MEHSRRDFLRALGVGATGGLAGCIDIPNRGPSGPVTLQPFPRSVSISDSHAVVMPQNLTGADVQGGEQVRLRLSTTNSDGEESEDSDTRPIIPGAFTRIDDPPIEPNGNVYMTEEAIDALQLQQGDSIAASKPVPNPNFNRQDAAREDEELLEQFVEATDRENYIVIAPYGGDMQQNTGKQSIRVTSTDVGINAWALFGYDQRDSTDAYHRWQIRASDIKPRSYPKLPRNSNYNAAVSFEADEDIAGVLVNGFAERDFQQLMADRIRERLRDVDAGVRVRVADAGSTQTISPEHIANRLTGSDRNGVAVYQTQNVREVYWKEVADGVLDAIREETGGNN